MDVISRTLDLLERTSSLKRSNVRDILLAQFGPAIIPFCMAKFQATADAGYRADLLRFVLRYARTDDRCVAFAVQALEDRSRKVRHNACAVLAYSLREDAIGNLIPLVSHRDAHTAADAQRAIEAIRSHNSNRFYPAYSSWGVSADGPDQPKPADVERFIVRAAPELVPELTKIFGKLD